MENQTETEKTYAQSVGLDYVTLLSYTAIDASELSYADKRDALYSALCFRCLFDNRMAIEPSPILKKYNCLTMPEPAKLDLYELVYRIVTLNSATLETKSMWYLCFPYVIMLDAPHSVELYHKLQEVLWTDEVFETALQSRYSVSSPDCVREMWADNAPSLVVDWFIPFITYKDLKDSDGISRNTQECQRLVALGQFDASLARSEKLLNTFPDDENLLLINIAARAALFGVGDEKTRQKLLSETLALIDDALTTHKSREIYFLYYRGLCLLGLMDFVAARKQFAECMAIDPHFELALLMQRALDKYSPD